MTSYTEALKGEITEEDKKDYRERLDRWYQCCDQNEFIRHVVELIVNIHLNYKFALIKDFKEHLEKYMPYENK